MKKSRGYLEVDYDGTGFVVIEKDDNMGIFENDDQAAEAYVRDGGKILRNPKNLNVIPVDTEMNRKILAKAVFHVCVMSQEGATYISKLVKRIHPNCSGITYTQDISEAKKLKIKEVNEYAERVFKASGERFYVFIGYIE